MYSAGQYSVSSSVGEIHHLRVRCTRSVVLLVRSKTLGSGVLGQYSVRSFVGEIQDISVRCTRSVVLLVRSKTLGSDVLGQ